MSKLIRLKTGFETLYKDAWYLTLPIHLRITLKADIDSYYILFPRKKGHSLNGTFAETNPMFEGYPEVVQNPDC